METNQACNFLVDSQADISVIKISCIKPYIKFNENEIINITGITTNSISTLGTIHITITIGNYEIPQKCHIVSNNFNIPSNGSSSFSNN